MGSGTPHFFALQTAFTKLQKRLLKPHQEAQAPKLRLPGLSHSAPLARGTSCFNGLSGRRTVEGLKWGYDTLRRYDATKLSNSEVASRTAPSTERDGMAPKLLEHEAVEEASSSSLGFVVCPVIWGRSHANAEASCLD